ncbi:MAG TPA: hypothetical protein VEG27_07455 [Usitatibacter sp.]|nr:hypothetical protein [Usitatibacter sp.]
MKSLRHLGSALGLALALLFGEQAAALHDLGHAIQQVEHKGSLPLGSTCDECFACAQLAGAVGVSLPAVPLIGGSDAAPRERPFSSACVAPRYAFLSRGPPALL